MRIIRKCGVVFRLAYIPHPSTVCYRLIRTQNLRGYGEQFATYTYLKHINAKREQIIG